MKTLIFLILYFVVSLESISGRSNVINVSFVEPDGYFLDDKVLHQVIKVRVTDEIGNPVPFVSVDFLSSDTEIADFLFGTTITDSNGLAVSVIQIQVSEDTIISPPQEFYGRIPYITAIAEGVRSNEVPVTIWWGWIVDPIFMGPYFKGIFESFIDTSVLKLSSLALQGEFVEVFFPPPLEEFNFGTYSTDSRIAYANPAITGFNEIIVNVNGLAEGITNIIVDGIPPAVISIRVFSNTKVENHIHNLPTEPILQQNYPNPFNPSTTIKFALHNPEKVLIEVFTALGQKAATLLDKQMSIGSHEVEFNAQNLPSGVYVYRIVAGDFIAKNKCLLLK